MNAPPVPLLTNETLLASETVVNAAMNRGRGLWEVNSYERELRMKFTAFLRARAGGGKTAVWYDACCGEGRALCQAHEAWRREIWGDRVTLLGADLWDDFRPRNEERLRFIAADVVEYQPPERVDLLTCVHGVHYLGDKLKFLTRAYSCLAPGGRLIAHLDPANLRDVSDNVAEPSAAGGIRLWSRLLRKIRAAGVRGDIPLIPSANRENVRRSGFRNSLCRGERRGGAELFRDGWRRFVVRSVVDS